MKRLLPLIILVAIGALTIAAVVARGTTARSAQPEGVTITPLGHAGLGRFRATNTRIKLKAKRPADVLITSIVVDPGGTFGWHTHPGPVLVAVASGTLALYEPDGRRCSREEVGPGEGFVEDGGHLHLARNEGSSPVQIYATFLAPAGTTEFLTVERPPRACRI